MLVLPLLLPLLQQQQQQQQQRQHKHTDNYHWVDAWRTSTIILLLLLLALNHTCPHSRSVSLLAFWGTIIRQAKMQQLESTLSSQDNSVGKLSTMKIDKGIKTNAPIAAIEKLPRTSAW
jgi:hypothetical protein